MNAASGIHSPVGVDPRDLRRLADIRGRIAQVREELQQLRDSVHTPESDMREYFLGLLDDGDDQLDTASDYLKPRPAMYLPDQDWRGRSIR